MTQLPTLPGYADGVIEIDLLSTTLQCRGCGTTSTARKVWQAIQAKGMHFHEWPDGTNPRLCRDCRLARGCECERCREERCRR